MCVAQVKNLSHKLTIFTKDGLVSLSLGIIDRKQAQYHGLQAVDTRRHLGENQRSTTSAEFQNTGI